MEEEKYIFTAFANSRDQPLPALGEEDDKINGFLQTATKGTKVKVYPKSFCKKEDIRKHLIELLDKLIIFHYSGHGEEGLLITEEEATDATGIASLLGQAEHLKLIVLNACHSELSIENLEKLSSKPVVIYTNDSVIDTVAKDFSISFYQALCENKEPIKKAFEKAKGAKFLSVNKRDTEESRGRRTGRKKSDWHLYSANEEHKEQTFADILNINISPFNINETLTFQLIKGYGLHKEAIKETYKNNQDLTAEKDLGVNQRKIQSLLPHPISEQLRKLFAKSTPGENSGGVFFNRPDQHRLEQIIYACFNLLELIAFAHLSQLWEEIREKKIKIANQQELADLLIPAIAKKDIRKLVQLIKEIHGIFEEKKIPFFFKELNITQLEKPSFQDALGFFEDISQKLTATTPIREDIATSLHIHTAAEKHLGSIFEQLAFIINYKMDSIQSVRWMATRSSKEAIYTFDKVELFDNPLGKAEDSRQAIPTKSVYLKEEEGERSLNLTPFIIDENAFPDMAKHNVSKPSKTAKICSIKSFRNYTYRHVYKPKDKDIKIVGDPEDWMEATNMDRFKIIVKQLDDFNKEVFNNKLNA